MEYIANDQNHIYGLGFCNICIHSLLLLYGCILKGLIGGGLNEGYTQLLTERYFGCEKYNEDQKRIKKIIRAKNVKNLQTIKEQMKTKKEKEKNRYGMSDVEFAMNKGKLIKAQEALG